MPFFHLEDLAASLACHFHARAVLEGWREGGWVGRNLAAPVSPCGRLCFPRGNASSCFTLMHFNGEYEIKTSKASFIFFTSLRRKEWNYSLLSQMQENFSSSVSQCQAHTHMSNTGVHITTPHIHVTHTPILYKPIYVPCVCERSGSKQ